MHMYNPETHYNVAESEAGQAVVLPLVFGDDQRASLREGPDALHRFC